jgi:hypothetical protein
MSKPKAKPPATGANTPTTIYLDTFNKKPACADDRKAVVKNCQPEPAQSEEDEKKGKKKTRKKGISGKLGEAAELFDDAGKLAADYRRDRGSVTPFDGNGWMDEHCTGMWLTPGHLHSPELEMHLNDMLDKLESAKRSLLMDGFEQLRVIAVEKAGSVAQHIAEGFLIKTGVKAVAGVIFGETVVVPVLMWVWTIADLFLTAEKLAALAGDKGKAALEALKSINNIGDKSKEILESYKKEPHRAHADAMTLMALLDPCLRARKCLLTPFENTAADGAKDEAATEIAGKRVANNKAKSQAKHGLGCCPGQTGHHILPDAMVGDLCPGYDYDKAPTMCLEGTQNGEKHGSHGMAHGALKKSIDIYKKFAKKDTLSYQEAKDQGIDAVRLAGAIQCDRKCLEAQLDAHYKGCVGKELNADAGNGGRKATTTPKVTPKPKPKEKAN